MSEENLLPIGFYDVYGEQAKKIYKLTNQIIDYLLENEFDLFSPSPVEYRNPNDANTNNKQFRVLDPLSNNILTIRSDITKQASRAINYNDSDLLKICYDGEVLRLNIDKINQARSLKQTGFEIMSKSPNLDIEQIAFNHISSLIKKIKCESYTIVFSSVLIKDLLLDICDFEEKELINIFAKNDFDKIANSTKLNVAEMLSPKKIDFFSSAEYKNYDSSVARYYDKVASHFEKLPGFLHKNFIFDPLNFNFSDYNTGSFFCIFDNNTNKVMARGGEYIVKDWGKAYGVSFYVEAISLTN